MRSMLAPPGAGGFGGPDGESALDRFTQDLTQVWEVWEVWAEVWVRTRQGLRASGRHRTFVTL